MSCMRGGWWLPADAGLDLLPDFAEGRGGAVVFFVEPNDGVAASVFERAEDLADCGVHEDGGECG